jgi:septal ring factor EnvC (AmiA/AmiB activator)
MLIKKKKKEEEEEEEEEQKTKKMKESSSSSSSSASSSRSSSRSRAWQAAAEAAAEAGNGKQQKEEYLPGTDSAMMRKERSLLSATPFGNCNPARSTLLSPVAGSYLRTRPESSADNTSRKKFLHQEKKTSFFHRPKP